MQKNIELQLSVLLNHYFHCEYYEVYYSSNRGSADILLIKKFQASDKHWLFCMIVHVITIFVAF
eukprot:UN24098